MSSQVVEWPEDISELAVTVADRLRQVEESGVKRIDACYRAFASALAAKGAECNALRHEAAEWALRRDLTAYFEPEGASGSPGRRSRRRWDRSIGAGVMAALCRSRS